MGHAVQSRTKLIGYGMEKTRAQSAVGRQEREAAAALGLLPWLYSPRRCQSGISSHDRSCRQTRSFSEYGTVYAGLLEGSRRM